MTRAFQSSVAVVAALFVCFPAAGKTTPPSKVCESLGGKWDGERCIMPYRPRPNPPPYSTQGTGTRYEVNPKFKGQKWTVKR